MPIFCTSSINIIGIVRRRKPDLQVLPYISLQAGYHSGERYSIGSL